MQKDSFYIELRVKRNAEFDFWLHAGLFREMNHVYSFEILQISAEIQ